MLCSKDFEHLYKDDTKLFTKTDGISSWEYLCSVWEFICMGGPEAYGKTVFSQLTRIKKCTFGE